MICPPSLDLRNEVLPIAVDGVNLVVTPPGDFSRIRHALGLNPLAMVRPVAVVRRDAGIGDRSPAIGVDAEDVKLVKIHCNLDISERRWPHGGAMDRTIAGRVVDLRVQTQPTLFGKNIVLRLSRQITKRVSIAELGFNLHDADRYRRPLGSPSGRILVVGPTGSGKTTTQYAALSLFARDETRQVSTIEDPVEYALPGVQQTQIHPVPGYTSRLPMPCA